MRNWYLTKKCSEPVLYRPLNLIWPRWERLFENFLSDFLERPDIAKVDLMPALDIHEKDNKVIVETEIPGMDKKDLSIRVDDGVLTISGEKKIKSKEEKDDYYREERSFGKFERSVRLPSYVKEDAVDASYKDGVLKIEIPCSGDKPKKGRNIEIK